MAEASLLIRESNTTTARGYARRVAALALLYSATFLLCLAGEVILFERGKLLVTLAQRSNVETLTLAFFQLFYLYVAVLSGPGLWGTLRLARAIGFRRAGREERKMRMLPRSLRRSFVALTHVVELEGADGRELRLPIRDEFGEVGHIEFRGARLVHCDRIGDGSNSLSAYVVEKLCALKGSPVGGEIDIVEWQSLDDEEAHKFACLVDFACRLEAALGQKELWPRLRLSREEWSDLERSLAELCPALRSEAFLPDWEYQGEHKIPVIPEPLGIVSIGRSEKRVDPVVSMSSCFLVVLLSVLLLLFLSWRPPWVPGI